MKIFLLVLREIHTFAACLIIKIKKYETVYNEPNDLWGGIILCSSHTRAEPYTLSYSLVDPNHETYRGSKSPKRPLVVDLVGHTLSLPSLVIGNTLTLESDVGEVYTYYITDTTFQIPQELSGEYTITIFDGNCMYQGMIEIL